MHSDVFIPPSDLLTGIDVRRHCVHGPIVSLLCCKFPLAYWLETADEFVPAKKPLQSVSVDMLDLLPKTKARNRSMIVIADCFTKVTQVFILKVATVSTLLKRFITLGVQVHHTEGVSVRDRSAVCEQLYQNTCRIFDISNNFTSAYHPQTNREVI